MSTATPTTVEPDTATPIHEAGNKEEIRAIALRSFDAMTSARLADFEHLVHPDALNREQVDEPPAARGMGPRAWHSVAEWLHAAFSELRWDVHDSVVEGDLVAVHVTMSGRHTRDFVAYDSDANVDAAFPPTKKRFAVTQTHWLRVADGQLIEHWANRDDMGMAMQLGWAPPTPLYLVRMALAKRRATRAHSTG